MRMLDMTLYKRLDNNIPQVSDMFVDNSTPVFKPKKKKLKYYQKKR